MKVMTGNYSLIDIGYERKKKNRAKVKENIRMQFFF